MGTTNNQVDSLVQLLRAADRRALASTINRQLPRYLDAQIVSHQTERSQVFARDSVKLYTCGQPTPAPGTGGNEEPGSDGNRAGKSGLGFTDILFYSVVGVVIVIIVSALYWF